MIIQLSMLGYPPREIGTQIRKPTSIVTACLKSQWAQDHIRNTHEKFLAAMQQKTFEPTTALFEKLQEKIELLDALTKSENPSVAMRALEFWVNHTLGSPIKRSEVKLEGTVAHASIQELRFIRDNGRLPTAQEKLMLTTDYVDSETTDE